MDGSLEVVSRRSVGKLGPSSGPVRHQDDSEAGVAMGGTNRIFRILNNEGISGIPSRVNQRFGLWSSKGTPTGRICLKPFYYASLEANGYIYSCCQGWAKFCLGKLGGTASFGEIWNGRMAQLMREGMLTTELNRVCKMNACPYILDQRLPHFNGEKIFFTEATGGIWPCEMEDDHDVLNAIRRGDKTLTFSPKHLEISVDQCCNIYCKSCRTERITTITKAQQKVLDSSMQVFDEIGPRLKRLSMLGSGEVFFSQFSLNLLRKLSTTIHQNLIVDIVTNGQLLNETTWSSLGEGRNFIKSIAISIDAAKKHTYETIRRGAQWEKVMENMDFVQSLRRAGAIDFFSINFVISAENFREMTEFISLGRKFLVDKIVFTALQPWNRMDYEFRKFAVHLESHPLYHEFQEIVANPAFKSDMVVLGA